jgi:pimeloyl-ACP methyl ester carboxylesterase
MLPALEREHEVLAPTLPGHAGGPALPAGAGAAFLADAVESAMDEAGFRTAHLAGNSLGGFVALLLATRGRAESVVALSPAGGWGPGDRTAEETLALQLRIHEAARAAAPRADELLATAEGRRRATQLITERFEHIPRELLVHQLLGVARCSAAGSLVEEARAHDWALDTRSLTCPLTFVWGAADRLLPWPSAAARFRVSLPHADWIVLDGVGHCPQLDVPLETSELILGSTRSIAP